jgi:hypothetical protein
LKATFLGMSGKPDRATILAARCSRPEQLQSAAKRTAPSKLNNLGFEANPRIQTFFAFEAPTRIDVLPDARTQY